MVKMEEPQIISLFYRPEPDDPNRGSCEWARFYFDLKNYVLSIESDCGTYGYGWVPTPKTESFLQLCTRFEPDYLLCKISSETVVDGDETFGLMKELVCEINEANELAIDTENWTNFWYEINGLKRACQSYHDSDGIWIAINDILSDSDLSDLYESYDIYDRIVMTYPRNAKKIAEIFCNEIQPFIKENLFKKENG